MPLYTAKARELLGPYVSVAVDAVTSLSLQVMAAARAAVQYCVDKKPVVEQWVSVQLSDSGNDQLCGFHARCHYWLGKLSLNKSRNNISMDCVP